MIQCVMYLITLSYPQCNIIFIFPLAIALFYDQNYPLSFTLVTSELILLKLNTFLLLQHLNALSSTVYLLLIAMLIIKSWKSYMCLYFFTLLSTVFLMK